MPTRRRLVKEDQRQYETTRRETGQGLSITGSSADKSSLTPNVITDSLVSETKYAARAQSNVITVTVVVFFAVTQRHVEQIYVCYNQAAMLSACCDRKVPLCTGLPFDFTYERNNENDEV